MSGHDKDQSDMPGGGAGSNMPRQPGMDEDRMDAPGTAGGFDSGTGGTGQTGTEFDQASGGGDLSGGGGQGGMGSGQGGMGYGQMGTETVDSSGTGSSGMGTGSSTGSDMGTGSSMGTGSGGQDMGQGEDVGTGGGAPSDQMLGGEGSPYTGPVGGSEAGTGMTGEEDQGSSR